MSNTKHKKISPPINQPIQWLAIGLGAGLIPKMPGTAGTVVAAVLYFFLLQNLPFHIYIILITMSMVVGVYICQKASEKMGNYDHPSIVWDEWVGYWVTMIWSPQGIWWCVIGFIIFRYFDIKKPWPINWCDKHVKGGLGIMLDDIIAGVMAFLCMQFIVFTLH